MFTENETNFQKVNGQHNKTPFVKDAFHDAIIRDINLEYLRNRKSGTKFAPVYKLILGRCGETKTTYCRLTTSNEDRPFASGIEKIFARRKAEADDFYRVILPTGISDDLRNIQRKALSGLLWSKQYYHFDVEKWDDHQRWYQS